MSAMMRGAMRAATVGRLAQVTSTEIRTASSLLQTRSFSRTSPTFDAEPQTARAGVRTMHKPTNFDKKKFVMAKMYPSIEAVPAEVNHSELHVAREWFRIRVLSLMILFGFIACYMAIRAGRSAHARGENLQQRGEIWVAEQEAIGKERRAKESQA